MKRKHLIVLMDQLEMYVRAGLSIDHALMQTGALLSKRPKTKLFCVSDSVRMGRRLSASIAQEFVLPAAIQGLIESGENSGTLADTLGACKAMLERQDELIKKSVSAMVYPLVIGIATLGLTIGLMEGVIPQIIPLLTSLRSELPLLTRITIGASQFLSAWWLYLLVAGTSVSALSVFLYRRCMGIRYGVHVVMLCTPIAGILFVKHALAIFFESLGSMIQAGIPAHDAYVRALGSIGLIPVQRKFSEKIQPLIRGEPFSIVSQTSIRGMPTYVGSLLAAGESSGSLGACMRRISSMLERELEHTLKHMTSLLEPVMMIGMGGVVGSIALSIMLPIYDISRALQH